MRLRRNLVAWFLVFALALMSFPVMAEDVIATKEFLKVGEKIQANDGDTINYYGYKYLPYYTTSSSLKIISEEERWYGATIKEAKSLHMAPINEGKQWYVERREDKAIPYYSDGQYQYDNYYTQYAIYPAQMYYAATYDLGEGSWEVESEWIEEENGIWKPETPVADYDGNLWYAYAGYTVILPTATEVTKAGYELSGWKVGADTLLPGATYSLKGEDATDINGQPTIKIEAIWKNKSISNPTVSEITKTSAKISVAYNVEGELTDKGIKIAKAETEDWTNLETTVNNNQITAVTDSLSKNTSYKVKAYLATATGEITTEEITFQTLKDFEVEKAQVGDITTQGASFTASYLSDDALTAQGFKYKKTSEETDEWQEVEATASGSSITASLDNLLPNTEYSVKAYITTSEGTKEGEVETFTTSKRPQSVEKAKVSGVTGKTATFTASYLSDDGLTAQGFKYKKTSEETEEWQEVEATVSGSIITASLDNLLPNTEYSVKAYITTSEGTKEGEVETFTTSKRPQSVEKAQISGVTTSTATFTTKYVSDTSLTNQGFKYKKAADSKWTDIKASTTNVNEMNFSTKITGLTSNTTYEVKAYIETKEGVTESQVSTFTTSTSSSSGSSSSSSSTSPAKVEPTITLPAVGEPLVVSVNSNNVATVPVDTVNSLINSGQPLVIQSGNISLTADPSTLKEILLANPGVTNLTMSLPAIEAVKLEDIKLKANQEGKITIVGGSEATLSIGFGSSQIQSVFSEPLTVTIDLSKVSFGDSTKLTFVKYEQKEDGSYKVVKLGGTYDEATGKFSAHLTEPGLYGMAEVAELVKVNLQIGNLISTLNDSSRTNDVAPQIVGGSTVVPLRFIAESLGAEVKWDAKNKKVVITLDGQTIEVGSDQGMLIQESRTLVPIRYISENLGANVLWIPSSKSIEIVK